MVVVNPLSVKKNKERIQMVMRMVASQENQDDPASDLLIKAANYIDTLENIRLALVDVIDNLKPLVPKMELKDGRLLSQNLEQLKVFAATFYLLEKAEEKEDARINKDCVVHSAVTGSIPSDGTDSESRHRESIMDKSNNLRSEND